MTTNQSGASHPVYQQSVFSVPVPLQQHSAISTIPVASANFSTPQILFPGALPTSFQPVVPMPGVSRITPSGGLANLQSGAMFPYPYITSMARGVQNISLHANPAQDAQSVVEDRKKFDKERQFQLQQQKLKQFSSSGINTNVTSDSLIENMFGKTEKIIPSPSTATQQVIPTQLVHQVTKSEPVKKSSLPFVNEVKNSTKNLDHMMQQCSNLTVRPQKAKTFQKPAVKDLKATENFPFFSQPSFSSSQKSRDWSCVQGFQDVFTLPRPRMFVQEFQDVFTLPRPRFPAWCSAEWVPSLYKQIEQYVTSNGQHTIETNQLYSVLLLSGLPRDVLGHIWNLVNITTPGQLTQEELYAMLALIAVVQSGCPVSSTAILHSLPRPPIPALSGQQAQAANASSDNPKQPEIGSNSISDKASPEQHFCEDDDFGDFCSVATANVMENALTIPSQNQHLSTVNMNMDSQNLQQTISDGNLDCTSLKTANVVSSQCNRGADVQSANLVHRDTVPQVHMKNFQANDKYAVFKELDSKNDFISKEKDMNNILSSSLSDDFGDFLCADTSVTNVPPLKDEFDDFSTVQSVLVNEDFADFDAFQSVQLPAPEIIFMQDNDDFGDFASSQQTRESLMVETGSRGFQKDNISLGETQSICSLDLGLYSCDNIAYNSEGLRRQGSIPSLDLRPSGLDDSENGNSDEVLHKSSPQSVEEDASSGTLSLVKGGVSTVAPLIDKYSFIRDETESIILEDKLSSEWLKCLRSCDELLQNANHIFEQMSNNQVMSEVLATEEGQDYVKNIIEIYRVAERIRQSSTAVGKQNEDLHQVLASVKQAWIHLTSFLIKTSLMEGQGSLDFSSALPRSESDSELAACGVCLLTVDSENNLDQDKLIYGGRQYHSTCANLWVNCVDLLLPALPVPHLL